MTVADVAVVGAGIAGLACAYYLSVRDPGCKIVIIDPLAPMSLTSAASGENYRNWWPHPVMTAFTDFSIGLMEGIARETGNRIHMTRRGYALATRVAQPDDLLGQLQQGYGPQGTGLIRNHAKGSAAAYQSAASSRWEDAPDGVDVIQDPDLIRREFPGFDPEIRTILHIRRAGDISGQQLGSVMLERVRACGGRLITARLAGIERTGGFVLELDGAERVQADIVVNAAGPQVARVAAMLGEAVAVRNVYQQKIAFEDEAGVVARQMPFSIDLDGQLLDWTAEERALLRGDPTTAWLAGPMPGGIHCRPDGGEHGNWVKLGWAYNREPSNPCADRPADPDFPDIVLRAASRLTPGLKRYYGRLPRRRSHYGGYYTMTEENWPLIGPMRAEGAFIAGALSGYGTMAACGAGALCAAWALGGEVPDFARPLSPQRYANQTLMQGLLASASKGIL